MATTYDKASLVMIPSGYKDDKLYSIKPTDGSGDFTFSRDGAGASPATRVNASGLIEKGRENLLLYSEQFDNAYWLKTNFNGGTSPSVTANYGTSPIGTNTADRVQFPAQSGSEVSSLQTPISFAYPLLAGSIYVRTISGTCSNLVLRSGATEYVVPSFGTDWVRVETFSQANGANEGLSIRNRPSVSGDGSAIDIMVWGAQLEQGLVATDYIETTTAPVSAGLLGDMPRLDYHNPDSPTPNSCPNLLLEPSRTNVFTDSEYFNGADWILQDATITNNAAISPEGVQNASLYTSASELYDFVRQNISFVSGTTYTYSVFAKAGTSALITLGYNSAAFGSGQSATFDLSDGTYTLGSANPIVTMEDYGNNWWRCSITATATATMSRTTGFSSSASGAVTTMYIYGAQLESGSYPTSYIPTYGSAAQRSSDSCSKTGVADLVGSQNGTIFLDFVYDNNFANTRIFSLSGATWNVAGSIRLEKSGTKFKWNWTLANAGAGAVDSTTDMVVGTRYKMAVSYTATSASLFINGVKEDTAPVSTPSAMTGIFLNELGGGYSDVYEFQRNIFNQVVMFQSTLTDAEAIALTTL